MYTRKPPTFGDDIVIARLKWLLIAWNIPQTIRGVLMPQNEVAADNHEDLHHCIEVCICDTIGENQTTERLRKVVRIIEVDVACC